VKALGVDPRDEVDVDASQRPHIGEHPPRDSDPEPVLSVHDSDELHTLVSEQIAEEEVDF
jgi:hypothetical protein